MMTDDRGHQKGAQGHAEGEQGPKTTKRQIEQLESGESGETERQDAQHPADGKHRLYERREQHDEADLNSEKNRLSREARSPDREGGAGAS